MRKVLPYLNLIIACVLTCVITSCSQSNEDKARELVERYCDSNYDSPGTYNPIDFEKLQIYNQPYEHSDDYKALNSKKNYLDAQKDSLFTLSQTAKKPAYDRQIDSIDRAVALINKNMVQNKLFFKGRQEGWMIEHTYTKKNDFGALIKTRSLFILNNNFTRVIQTIDK